MLSRRALNRATLARQMLLHRERRSVPDTIEHLVGLQAQTPHSWYIGLWSRLDGCRPEPVGQLLNDRQVVRIALMRSTIHLVTARDCLALRPLVQPVLERSMRSNFGRHLVGLDEEALAAAGRALAEQRPRTFHELGALLAQQRPGRDPAALAQAVRAWVPLVQVPPRGVWGASGPVAHTSAESWLGRPLDPAPSLEDLVLRYLAAFGPATAADAQTWSGLTRLRDVFARLRPRLVSFRDEHSRELFDLPDAPRPDPDTPAPPRLLYEYDNLLLSHADRSRFRTPLADRHRPSLTAGGGPPPGTVLIDGFLHGTWQLTRHRDTATLTVQPFGLLSTRDNSALAQEAESLLAFAAADAGNREVEITDPKDPH